ncbi:hypothetical protein MASR2M70_17460 [Bacillota bacterium]
MKKRLMIMLLVLGLVISMIPSSVLAASAATIENPYLVGSNPVYRLVPDGEIIGEFPSGTVVDVIEIKGDWARIRHEGKEYYMWAPRLSKLNTGTSNPDLSEKPFAPPDGWYTIETPSFSGKSTAGVVIIGKDGAMVDVTFEGFEYYWQRYIYVDNIGNNQVTLKTLDGKYLGISDPIKDGTRVKAVDKPYVWNAYTTTALDHAQADPTRAWISFRPPQNTDMIVNVSGWKFNEEGAEIIIWSSKLGTVDGNAKLSWGGLSDPNKTLAMRDLIELLNNHIMKQLYPNGFSLDPSQGHFPPAANAAYKNYYLNGSGPNPYEGIKDANGNPKYDTANDPGWIGRLRMWGVLPGGDYNGATGITYGQFTAYLKKLMAYERQNAINWGKVEKFYNPREVFTDAIIKKFGFGDIKSDSKITYLQAMLLCDATVQWWYSSASVSVNDEDVPYKKGDLPFPYKYAYIFKGSSQAATPSAPPAAAGATAKPTNTKFMLNNEEVGLPAYAIDGNNYVKLRDVGALLKTSFDVRWEDGKAKLYNHAIYTKAGGELVAIGTDSKSASKSATNFVWGDSGAAVTGLSAYTIGGNNYIKLRDIAKLFDFDVDWRDGKAWIEPDVSPYTED